MVWIAWLVRPSGNVAGMFKKRSSRRAWQAFQLDHEHVWPGTLNKMTPDNLIDDEGCFPKQLFKELFN